METKVQNTMTVQELDLLRRALQSHLDKVAAIGNSQHVPIGSTEITLPVPEITGGLRRDANSEALRVVDLMTKLGVERPVPVKPVVPTTV